MSLTVTDAIALYLDHRRPRVAPRSYAVFAGWLQRWVRWRVQRGYPPELQAVTLAEWQAYFAVMEAQGLAPSSRDSTWRVFKAMWRLLARRGLLTAAQQTFFGEDGLAPVRVPDEIFLTYNPETIVQLLGACASADPEQAARNRAIIFLLWQTGARVAELCSLTDEKSELAARRGVIRGKGNRQRWIFWDDEAAQELGRYLADRRGPWGGPLLRDLRDGAMLTENAIRQMLRRVANRAGVRLIVRSPLHGFRRTFAHEALDAGIADLDLQQLLGHRSIVSTQRYTRRDPARLAKVYQRLRSARKGVN